MCKITYRKITLTNGITVANILSEHSFKFTDGSELIGVDTETRIALLLEEVSIKKTAKGGRWRDMYRYYEPTESLVKIIEQLDKDDTIDIILVSKVVLQVIQKKFPEISKKLRCPYIVDGSGTISVDTFIKEAV